MIISIGFRVNSKKAIKFRTWANKIIKDYMVQGFALNDERFLKAKKTDQEYFKKLLEKDEIDAVITLGAVIEGATDHDQIVAQHASRKIADLSLEYEKPVALGISGPGMTRLDAHKRVDYGKRAVEAAIKMCDRLNEI